MSRKVRPPRKHLDRRPLVLVPTPHIIATLGPLGEHIPYCVHQWEAPLCHVCHPSAVCVHTLDKYACRVCNPNGWCPHGFRAASCRVCQAPAVCPHGVWRRNCHHGCQPLEVLLRDPRCCQSCGNWVAVRRPERLCRRCDTHYHQRTEEVVWAAIKDALPYPSSHDNVTIGHEGTCHAARRRPDISWVLSDRMVDLEIDEHSHHDRPIACELAKLDDTKWGCEAGQTCVIVVRFNPDASECQTPLAERCRVLIATLQRVMQAPLHEFDALRCNVLYLYYNRGGQKHVLAAQEQAASICVLGSI